MWDKWDTFYKNYKYSIDKRWNKMEREKCYDFLVKEQKFVPSVPTIDTVGIEVGQNLGQKKVCTKSGMALQQLNDLALKAFLIRYPGVQDYEIRLSKYVDDTTNGLNSTPWIIYS